MPDLRFQVEGAEATLDAARTRFRSDTTFSSPDGVRTAHAHAVGPCTSTPFASAIPPRRTFSSFPIGGQGS